MKTLKFLFVLFALIGLSFQAMPQAVSWETNTGTMKTYYCIDTVANSTGVTIVFPQTIPAGWGYIVEVVADSLSGSTAGTITLLTTAGVTTRVYKAITSGTATVDGVQTIAIFSPAADQPSWHGTRMEVTVTGGGTQSTKIRCWMTIKKLPLY